MSSLEDSYTKKKDWIRQGYTVYQDERGIFPAQTNSVVGQFKKTILPDLASPKSHGLGA